MRTTWWRVTALLLLALVLALTTVQFGLLELENALLLWLGIYLAREAWVVVYHLWGVLNWWRFPVKRHRHIQALRWFGIEVAAFLVAAFVLIPSKPAF